MLKNKKDAGADNLTASLPQYFSWINNTNEGSTEAQTLINLEFFRYLKETYGMEIRIYAWDAGNFDGASEGYGDLNSAKFRSQYPEGYKNVVSAAKKLGIRMGLWGSPDGYGDTEQSQKERFDFFVHLCRDYNWGLFKLDGVCGHLRPEKAGVFAQMLKECRRYSPDLIVLNHRLNFYEAEKHSTTYLWNGDETYVDVSICNKNTAMHHREYMFGRGHTDNLERLAEDHGVCISSNVDYFEDELIYQAFNRSLILAPEMYGNPWFMRDDELPRLARVYNLHRRNAEILVNGKLLPDSYGANPCSRGSAEKRFVSTGNDSWEAQKITLSIGEEIGIETDKRVQVNVHHPYEKYLGEFNAGDSVEIELLPFRAALIEVSTVDRAEPMLRGCEYEIIKEDENGVPVEVKILSCDGSDIMLVNKGSESFFMNGKKTDIKESAPVFLGSLDAEDREPANAEELYEAAMFAVSNDSLEAQTRRRSGETDIPEVKAARAAFFNQPHYALRGCEAANMFDSDSDTFFDSQSKTYCNGMRIDGGCLRVDFGKVYDCDSVEIEYFCADKATQEVAVQQLTLNAEYSADLKQWRFSDLVKTRIENGDFTAKIIRFCAHTLYDLHGKRLVSEYGINGKIRYLRIENPVDRIYAVRLIKDGKQINASVRNANNMQAHFRHRKTQLMRSACFELAEYKSGSRLTVAVDGTHGEEGVYCVAEIDGELYGFPERAPDYKANVWEHRVCPSDKNNTFFLPLPDNSAGKELKVYALFSDRNKAKNVSCKVYICPEH